MAAAEGGLRCNGGLSTLLGRLGRPGGVGGDRGAADAGAAPDGAAASGGAGAASGAAGGAGAAPDGAAASGAAASGAAGGAASGAAAAASGAAGGAGAASGAAGGAGAAGAESVGGAAAAGVATGAAGAGAALGAAAAGAPGAGAPVAVASENVPDLAAVVMRDSRATRRENCGTGKAYGPYQKEFKEFCHSNGWSEAVDARKLLQFVTFLAARKVKKRKRDRDGGGFAEGTSSLEPATMKLAVNAVKDLWVAQEHNVVIYKGCEYARGEDPRTKSITEFLAAYLVSTSARRTAEFRDPTIGTVADGGGDLDLPSITVMLLQQGTEVADRTLYDILAGHSNLGRGDEKRNQGLQELVAVPMNKIGPSCCVAVIGLLSSRKNSNMVGMQFHSMVRGKDWRTCGVFALSVYLWRRFEHNHEPFPDFHKGRPAWYGTKVLANSQSGADLMHPICYSSEATQVGIVLKKKGVKASKVTHLFRSKGAESLETNADGLLQEGQTERLGGWNVNVFRRIYQNGVPAQAVMIQAGHPATHFTDNFVIPESPLKAIKPPTEILKGLTKLYGASGAWLAFEAANPDAVLDDGKSICGSSTGFSTLCMYLAEVLVEIAPFMQLVAPNHVLFKSRPFNEPAFIAYAIEQRERAAVRNAAEPSSAVDAATAKLESPFRRAFHAVSSQIAGVGTNVAAQLSTMLRAVTAGPREQQQQQQQSTTFNFDLAAAPLLPSRPLLLEDGAPPVPRITINVLPSEVAVQPVGRLSRELTSVLEVWQEKTEGIHGQPSIDSLVAKHGNGWHTIGRDAKDSNAEKGYKNKRNVFWKEIARLAGEHMEAPAAAASRLQIRFAEGSWAADPKKKKLSNFKDLIDAEAKARKRLS